MNVSSRPNHWRTVGGVIDCAKCGSHAFIVLQPTNVPHPTKYRVYLGPGHKQESDAIVDSYLYGLALADVAEEPTVKVVPDLHFEGWEQEDVDDLHAALEEADAVLGVLASFDEAAKALEVEGVGQVAVNAPGGEA